MTAAYVPQVGDRVRMRGWEPTVWVDVVAIERGFLFGFDQDGYAEAWSAAHGWVKVTPPPTYPERWINVYPDGLGDYRATKALADEKDPYGYRIAVIHLAADGTVTLHPVERES